MNRFPKSRWFATALVLGGIAATGAPFASSSAADLPNALEQLRDSTELKKLLENAERASTTGDLMLALVQLKNAVRLAPRNGAVRAYLGIALLKSGDTRNAERELRDARKDRAADELVVPPLLDAMVVRGEAATLLDQFPEPTRPSKVAPDILRARAMALQMLGRTSEASASMARSVRLRRDTRALTASAKLAVEQGDLAQAQRFIDDAIKLDPKNEEVRTSQLAMLFEAGDLDKALDAADEFVRRSPLTIVGRVIRTEILLAMNKNALAQAEVDALQAQSPDSSFVSYYNAVLLARANNFAAAWHEAQTLNPEFVLSQPGIAMVVAEMAIGSGNLQTGSAILASLVSRRPQLMSARIRLASVRLTLNDVDTALELLQPLKDSEDPQVQALVGQANLQTGRFTEAITALEKALGSGALSGTTALQRQLGQSAFEAGDSERALKTFKELQAREPRTWANVIPLVAALMQAGKFDEALEFTDQVVKDAGRTPIAPFYRGRVLAAKGDLAAAEASFGQALSIDPKFIPALYFRAHVLAARGDTEKAKKDLQQILAQDRSNIYAYIALAKIAGYEGQREQTLALLTSAVQAAGKDPGPRLALANELINQRKFADARATLDALLTISLNNPQAITLIGLIQFMNGEAGKAVETFRSLAATFKNSTGTYVLLAKALDATKDRLAAVDAARRAVELSPFSVRARGLLAEYMIAANRQDQALDTAREFVSVHPGPEADSFLASVLTRLNKANEAKTYLVSRLAAKPDRLLAMHLSQLAMNTGDKKKAVSVLTEWLQKNPNDYDVRRQYGTLLLQTADNAGARKEFETLIKQRPEDPIVLNNLAWLLRSDDPARAYAMATLAAKVAPDSTLIMDTLAWMKFERRDLQGALAILRRAHELDQANGEIGYHYAVALDATGRRAEAKTVLQSAVAKSTDFDDKDNAKQLLARW